MIKHTFQYLAVIACLLCWAVTPALAQSFVHPGLDMTREDLEYMKKQVKEGREPWKKAFEVVKANTPLDFECKPFAHVISGPFAKPDIGGNDLMRSTRMAYACSVLWYITEDERYAQKAIEIIDAWSGKLRSFDENNAKFLVGFTGYEFCNAAEILRYTYPKWTEANTKSITSLMMSAYFPVIRYYFPDANGNWDGANVHTLMAIAVLTDNRQMFDNAAYHYFHATCNGSVLKYVYPNGQCQETCRDQGHVQMGLFEFASAARVAYTQGLDLFSGADNRLALGLEYTANWINGGDVFAYGVPSERERYRYRGGFEFACNYYKAQGIDMPHMTELIRRCSVDRLDHALWKLTSYSVAVHKKKPASLRKIAPLPIATLAGAKTTSNTGSMEDVMIIQPNQNLQSVLNANAGKGKTLLLRKGEYRLKESLLIPSGIHMRGEGLETVLICEPSVRTAAMLLKSPDVSDVTIENLVVEGAWDHNAGSDPNTGRFNRTGRLSNNLTGISFRGEAGHRLANITFKDLTVINFSRSGVYLSDAENVTIENCNFSDNGSHVVPGPKLQHNLLMHHSKNIRILNSRFDASLKGVGIALEHCSDIRIEKSEVARNDWHGILLADCEKVLTTDCLIEANGACGIYSDYYETGTNGLTVKSNKIQYNNGYAVCGYAVKNSAVSGNRYEWNGRGSRQEFLSSKAQLQMEDLSSSYNP